MDPTLGIAGIPGGIGEILPGMRRQITPLIYPQSQVGLAGSHLACFIIPGRIPPIPTGIVGSEISECSK